MEEKIKNVKELLQKYEQEHLLSNFDKLNEGVGKTIEDINVKIEPISYVEKETIEENKKKEYFEKGANVLKANKLAVVTMAGGQGTRLRT